MVEDVFLKDMCLWFKMCGFKDVLIEEKSHKKVKEKMKILKLLKIKKNNLKLNLINRNKLIELLSLKLFSKEEIESCFNKYKNKQNEIEEINEEGIERMIRNSITNTNTTTTTPITNNNNNTDTTPPITNNNNPENKEENNNNLNLKISEIKLLLNPNNEKIITYNVFESSIISLGQQVDKRVWFIIPSLLSVGLSSGIILPCLPLLIQHLSLTSSQFGIIIASTGLAKLFTNLPASYYVEKWGRKLLLNRGLFTTSLGITGLGFSTYNFFSFPLILTSRLLIGLGVSTITTSGNMMVSDISNPLNRAKSFTPLFTSFQTGRAIGPAIGGWLIDHIGLMSTYHTVGGTLALIAILNHKILIETKPKSEIIIDTNNNNTNNNNTNNKPSIEKFNETIKKYVSILKLSPEFQHIAFLNFAYWSVISGSLLTLFPLHMISPEVALSGIQIGYVFAGLNTISVLCSYPIALISDKFFNYKRHISILGSFLVSSSIFLLPFGHSIEEFLMILFPLAIGSNIMQTVPPTYVMNIFPKENRSSALALYQTLGDFGIMIGASISGYLAHHTSILFTMETQSGFLLSTVVFCYINLNLINSKK